MTTVSRRVKWGKTDPLQAVNNTIIDAALKVDPKAVERREAEAAAARKKQRPTKKKAAKP